MNNETQKNDNHTEPAASVPAKLTWHAPEVEEVDVAETQNGGGPGGDGGGFS